MQEVQEEEGTPILLSHDDALDADVERLVALYNEKLIRQHSGFVQLPARFTAMRGEAQ